MNLIKLTEKTAALLAFLLIVGVAYGQPGSGGFGDDPQDVPVDGGLVLLAGAGIAYGARMVNNLRKRG